MNIAKNITELVGNTPLLEIGKMSQKHGAKAKVFVKLESFNPLSSVKDRVGLAMIEDAEKSGRLKAGGRIVEPTSGNTGIGIAYIAKAKGYPVTIVMPDTMSVERRNLLKALGAELVLTPGAEGMKGAIAEAKEIVGITPGAITLGQFDNPANPAMHKRTTAQEIWRDTDGDVDFVVAGVGTGGTITGIAEGLKEKKASFKAIAVEPEASPVLSGGQAGPHKIQGIGAGFVPSIYKPELIDEIILVSNDDAFAYAREIVDLEGVLVGISSGAALKAAFELAARPENEGKTIVAILPDSGERYLSTALFETQE